MIPRLKVSHLSLLLALCPFVSFGQSDRGFKVPALYHVGYWVKDIPRVRAFYTGVLGYSEPYVLNHEDGTLQMVVMKVNERQVIYLFNDATKIQPNGDNLDHLGLETDNAEAMRTYLLAKGLKVGAVHRGHIGDLILGIKDPDGHAFEVTQLVPEGQLMKHQGQSLAPGRVSSHLRGAAVATADLQASLHFYVDIVGFRRIAGGPEGAVRVSVPDGDDYLELRPYTRAPGAPAAHGVPEYFLDVADPAKVAADIAPKAAAGGFAAPSAVTAGPGGVPQASCIDPDGTRVVFVEAAKP